MLKYQSSLHRNNTSSSPQIDSMFLLAKLTGADVSSHIKAEKDQISEIRNMGKILFNQQFQQEVTFQQQHNNSYIQNNKAKQKLNLYERAKLNESKKWERIVETNKKQAKKIESLANTNRNTLNKTGIMLDNKYRSNQLHEPTQRKKQSYMMKQVLKKCIKEEQHLYQLQQTQKLLNYSKTNMYLKNTNYNEPPIQSKKSQKVVSKEELKKIFEQVNKRGDQLKKRKQLKIQKYEEQKKQKEMQGVTFYPQFQSTKSLRRNCTKGFIQRLKQDDYHRQKQKIQILATELKKDPFEPRLNNARNSLSKSKIDSFRLQDSIFLTHRRRAQQQFQKSLSRFIFPQEQQQYKQSRNQSLQIAINSKELNFLFQ